MATIPPGTKFGRLTVIKPGQTVCTKANRKKASSICQCECGKEISVLNNSLKSNLTKSCGCLNKEFVSKLGKRFEHKRIDGKIQAFKNYLASYKSGAKNRGHVWEITEDEFKKFTQSNCNYCGEPPRPYYISRDKYLKSCESLNIAVDHNFAEDKVIMVNGIDRIDNNIGYLLNNCVPCCPTCNRLKGSMSFSEWTSWLNRVAKFRYPGSTPL